MKKTNIIFWIATIVFAGLMLFTAIPEIMQPAASKEFMRHLGYPDYINPFIGVMKILGIIAILTPRYPRLKEWAYAGFFFDLLGATYSQIGSDGFKPEIAGMLIFFIPWAVSYVYFHKKLKVVVPKPAP